MTTLGTGKLLKKALVRQFITVAITSIGFMIVRDAVWLWKNGRIAIENSEGQISYIINFITSGWVELMYVALGSLVFTLSIPAGQIIALATGNDRNSRIVTSLVYQVGWLVYGLFLLGNAWNSGSSEPSLPFFVSLVGLISFCLLVSLWIELRFGAKAN